MGRNDQAVTAPVDVLAAMDAAIHKLGAESSGAEFAGDLLDALHAVAELIEAASNVRGASSQADWRRLDAALARVGGA